MKVCIFVANPCVSDSRVLRQAESFARAGHRTIVVALHRGGLDVVESRDGFEIRRVRSHRVTFAERYPRLARALGKAGPPAPPQPSDRKPLTRAQWITWLRSGVEPAPRAWARGRGTLVSRATFVAAHAARAGKKRWTRSRRRYSMPWALVEQRMMEAAVAFGPDLCWANDANTLPQASRTADRCGAVLFYDAHEAIWDAVAWPAKTRKRFAGLEASYAPKARRVFTVCDPIARELVSRYGVVEPTVLYNAPRLEATTRALAAGSSPLDEHRRAGEIIVLFHGGLSPHRGLEQLVRAHALLPQRYRLVFMGAGRMRPELESMTEQMGLSDRSTFLPMVPPHDLAVWLSGADVGLIPYQKVGRNHIYSTPNKLFECMHAGVPLVVNDLPEVRRIVTEVDFGVVTDCSDPAAIAKAIEDVTADAARHATLRTNALRGAHRYSWEDQERKIMDAVAALDR